MWIALAGLFALSVVGTVAFILFRRREIDEKELFRVRETKFTALFAAFLWAESAAVLYIVFAYPERLLLNRNAVVNTSVFLVAGVALGCAAALYYFVKQSIVRDDKVIHINLFGAERSLDWAQIEKASVTRTLVTLEGGGIVIKIRGEKNSFQQFLRVMEKKLPQSVIVVNKN